VRALAAAMIKHTGLLGQAYRAFAAPYARRLHSLFSVAGICLRCLIVAGVVELAATLASVPHALPRRDLPSVMHPCASLQFFGRLRIRGLFFGRVHLLLLCRERKEDKSPTTSPAREFAAGSTTGGGTRLSFMMSHLVLALRAVPLSCDAGPPVIVCSRTCRISFSPSIC
jgi:hypothetical protein